MDCSCAYCRRDLSAIDRVNDKLVDETTQRAFLGGVSHMYLRRRAAEARFCFPRTVYVGRRPMRWLSDLAAWVESPHAALTTRPAFASEVADAAE